MPARTICSISIATSISSIVVLASACSDLEEPYDPGSSEAVDDDRFGEAAFRSPGCSNPRPHPGGFTNYTLPASPQTRTYRVGVPSGYNPTAPHALFMSMHACGGTHMSANSAVANNMGSLGIPTITVAPDSAWADLEGNGDGRGPDGQKCWTLSPDWHDLEFVQDVIDRALQDYCIDTRNIFFSGGSSGAFASQGFGCWTGATAIAADRGGIHHPNGSWTQFLPTPAPPAGACGPIPALIGFARQDDPVPYSTFAPTAREFWRTNNGCGSSTSRDANVEDRVCHDGLRNCICERFSGCQAPFVMCSWDGEHSDTGIGGSVSAWWFSQFVDDGDGAQSDQPDGGDGGGGTEQGCASANDFVATFRLTTSQFPVSPYCDQCNPFGVRDSSGDVADFVVRWSNGLDIRVGNDDAMQWIEQRAELDERPYVRIRGVGNTLHFDTSQNGTSYTTRLTVANPFSGSVTLVNGDLPILTSASLQGTACAQ